MLKPLFEPIAVFQRPSLLAPAFIPMSTFASPSDTLPLPAFKPMTTARPPIACAPEPMAMSFPTVPVTASTPTATEF